MFRSIPFLDTVVSPGPDNLLLTTVYRKPTHIDQYLYWDSYHSLSTKYNVRKPLYIGLGLVVSTHCCCTRKRNI